MKAVSNVTVKIVERARGPVTRYTLSALCEHGTVTAVHQPTCRGSITSEFHSANPQSPEHLKGCAWLHPSRAYLGHVIMRLHGQRTNGCICNEHYWMQSGPLDRLKLVHPCRTNEGPLGADEMAGLIPQEDRAVIMFKVATGRLTSAHMAPLNREYIASLHLHPWPFSRDEGAAHRERRDYDGPEYESNDHEQDSGQDSGEM